MNPRGYPSGKHPYWATRLKDGTAFGMWFDPPVNKEQAMAAFESNFGLRPESIHALKKNPQRKR
ncbi:hypothetical protein KKE60_05810 [Patescibacteria group bacterium]|nr:hypothetical protein [Patescibacteria group bacterium]